MAGRTNSYTLNRNDIARIEGKAQEWLTLG